MRITLGNSSIAALVLMTAAGVAGADEACRYDPVTHLIVCPRPPTGPSGPTGTWLQRPREEILASPGLLLKELEIPQDLTKRDREVLRTQLEAKRNNLEEFRIWAEQTQKRPAPALNYQKSLEIYKTGIGQYRDALSGLK